MNTYQACGMEILETSPSVRHHPDLVMLTPDVFTIDEANVICTATGGGFFRDVRAADLVKVCRELIELRKGLMDTPTTCRCGGQWKFYNIGFDDGFQCQRCKRIIEVHEQRKLEREAKK